MGVVLVQSAGPSQLLLSLRALWLYIVTNSNHFCFMVSSLGRIGQVLQNALSKCFRIIPIHLVEDLAVGALRYDALEIGCLAFILFCQYLIKRHLNRHSVSCGGCAAEFGDDH